MAKPKTTTYDATKQYRVELTERTEVLGQTLYPGQDLTLRGDVLEGIEPAKIASATPVATGEA
ncbi:hypothetical protein QF021_000277 [Acidovorax delafieldii]|uniref:hypothetical protein n=1 Tax=Acidovorax delafieldii TaxID=47920 RepID=UPI002859E551|nr:hypothetical protein [Acidovorax delafieldii]MDR6152188.1 hypothetical protein [Acidovorax delafieldii]